MELCEDLSEKKFLKKWVQEQRVSEQYFYKERWPPATASSDVAISELVVMEDEQDGVFLWMRMTA